MSQTQNLPQSRPGRERQAVYARILVISLGLIYLINMGFSMYGGSVANTYMTEALDMSKSTLGIGFSLFTLVQGMSGIVVLLSIYKLGVKLTLLLGGLIILVGALLMRFSVTAGWQYVVIYGGVVGLGVGFGTVLPVTTSITLWFDKRRALAMSVVLTVGGLGGLVAAPLVDWVVTSAERGWQAGWELVALAIAISCLITILFVREEHTRTHSTENSTPATFLNGNLAGTGIPNGRGVYRTSKVWETADAMRSPMLWLFALGSLGFSAPLMLCVAHSAIHLRDLGVAPSMASMSLGLLTMFSITGRLLAGFLGDRIEPRLIWATSLLLLALGCLTIIRAGTAPTIVLFTFLVGAGFGAAYVCRPITIGNYFGTAAFASINGILGSILTVFVAVVPFLGGLARDARGSYTLAFVGIALFSAVSSLCLFAVREPQDKHSTEIAKGR